MADIPVADYIVDFFDPANLKPPIGALPPTFPPTTSFFTLFPNAPDNKKSFAFFLPPKNTPNTSIDTASGIFAFVARSDPPQANLTLRVTFDPPPLPPAPNGLIPNRAEYSLWNTTDTRTLHKVFGPLKTGMHTIEMEITKVQSQGTITFRDLVFWYKRLVAPPTGK